MVAKVPISVQKHSAGIPEEVLRLKASAGTKAYQAPRTKLTEAIQYCKEGGLCLSH